jgi:hypothetical protein
VVQQLYEENDVEADSKDESTDSKDTVGKRRGVVQQLLERDDVDSSATDNFGLSPLSYTLRRILGVSDPVAKNESRE